MDMLEFWVLAFVLFVGNAMTATPAASRRPGKGMLWYWLNAYCLIFVGVYLAFRIFAPGELAGESAPNDGRVWLLVTVAWAAAFSGVLCGAWVRRLRTAH